MIDILYRPIPLADLRERLSGPSQGAVVAFEGTVRDHHDGRKVVGLSYECYRPMALKVLEAIRREALRRWPIEEISITHRAGEVPIGEAAVLVLVASVHRKEAFEACAWAMDEIKREAPIWKHETYADGTSVWVEDSCVKGHAHEAHASH